MVRETRHLWVGNLPDNIREDRIREHFKRYGRVQNVKLLGKTENSNATPSACSISNSGICATVAFMDIKSASKAHNAEHILDERTLTTEYYEPTAIPTAAGAPSAGSSPAGSGYSGSSSSVNSTPILSNNRFHMSSEDSTANACLAAAAAAPATWRGTNDSASEYCRRGNTPTTYGRYQRNNSTAPYATPPSNVDRNTPHHRWYASGERAGGATGGESTPSTPGGGTEGGRRRRPSGSGSSRSDSSSPEPSDNSRSSTPAAQQSHPHHANHRQPTAHPHQWASTANGRPLAICVRNLPTRSTDSSLKDGLYHEYKKHGKVVWVKVVGQNADRYAVVRFKKPSDVEKALEVSQDKLFFGCKISVAPHQSCDEDADSAKPYETDIDEYHPKATRTLFIGNLEKDVTQPQLREKFKHFGRIIEIDIKKGSGGGAGYAFCQYASISSVVEAIRAMDGEHVGGSRVKLGFGKPVATTCVWVDGLTEHTEKQVLGAVSRCGAATSVCVDRAAGAALVHFEQAAAAGAAVRELRRVAAHLSALEPTHPRLCVDYASRECQEAFYEQLEKHGGTAALTGSERLSGDVATRYLQSSRHDPARFDGSGSRSRTSSFGRSSSRNPRYAALDQYDPADYAADRRYREYDEVGSSPPPEDVSYDERLQSVVVSPHRGRRHRIDSSPEERKHSKERHWNSNSSAAGGRRSRSGSRGVERQLSRRRHRRRRDGSRAGTPLRDEPDAPPTEPRRPPAPRDRPPLPMSLPLPKFAAQLLRSTPSTPRPVPAPAPASPPRPPSASSSSAGSAPHSPSLEERIRSLDEKYERWNGSRVPTDTPDRTRLRHRLLEIDINEVKPSDVVLSLLSKRSVFDEDTERLESATRVPSPAGSPRARPSPCVPRALRYPFPSHSVHVNRSSTPILDNDLDSTDRSLDPRLNRLERHFVQDKLMKINEIDYRSDSKLRLRTPSIDKSQQDINECKSSPSIDKERKDNQDPKSYSVIEKLRRDSFSTETSSTIDGSSKETKDTTLPQISNQPDISESILENKQNTEITKGNKQEDQSVTQTDNLSKKIVEATQKEIKDVDLKPVFIKSESENFHTSIKSETLPNTESKLDNSKNLDGSKPVHDYCSEAFAQNFVKNELSDYEIQQNYINALNSIKTGPEISKLSAVKSEEKKLKDSYKSHIIYEKELTVNLTQLFNEKTIDNNIHKFQTDCTISMLSEKSGKQSDNDNGKLKHFKDEKNFETETLSKMCKTLKDECKNEKINLERMRYDKESVKITKGDRDLDKSKVRNEINKKEKSEKDKKKDLNEGDNSGKLKKEDKHNKHDRLKKDSNDIKRDSKKESESSKSRKSSRDENLRDISRKDSTDSSTSKTSLELPKPKDVDSNDIKEENDKLKNKLVENTHKHKAEKDCTVEIKEDKISPEITKKIDSKSRNDITEKQRHYSLDSPSTDSKRKERLNSCSSLPSNIGNKRRMSSQDSFDSVNDDNFVKKSKLLERRDSKDSRNVERHKTTKFNKCHFAKIIESKTKDDKKNQVKPPDHPIADWTDSKVLEKRPSKKNFINETTKLNTSSPSDGLHNDIDFLATLELRSSEEDEKQKALRKEMKEKKRIQQLQQIQQFQMQQDALQAELINRVKDDKRHKENDKKRETVREKRMSTDRKSRDEKIENMKKRNRKSIQSTDSSDSDEPKKHSIFDIIDDGPTYISMYDKVKARSCKNMQKQEEEKRQEKIKAKFSQLKQSRAKREEKKRSSWDEDSDSDVDRRKSIKTSIDTSSEEDQMTVHNRKRENLHSNNYRYDQNRSNEYIDISNNEEESRNKLSRKNSRSRIISDTSDDETSKRSISPNYLNALDKDINFDSTSVHPVKHKKDLHEDKIIKNSILNLFGKSDSDDSKVRMNIESGKSNYIDFSSESESQMFNRHVGELRKKHKKKQKKHKFSFSDEDKKDGAIALEDIKHKQSQKPRRHSTKKERRRDKIRESIDIDDPREGKSLKKNKSFFDSSNETISNHNKREGKMEDIFGPLSDDSDQNSCVQNKLFPLQNYDSKLCLPSNQAVNTSVNDDSKLREEKRKKDKKRKEKRSFSKDDDNSLDVDAVSKAIEARLFADSLSDYDNSVKMDSAIDTVLKRENNHKTELKPGIDKSILIDQLNNKITDKVRRDSKEKKKKKKRNKEDRQIRKDYNLQNLNRPNDLEEFSSEKSELDIIHKTILSDIPLPVDAQVEKTLKDDCQLMSSLPRLTESPPFSEKSRPETQIIPESGNNKDDSVSEADFAENKIIEIETIPMPPPINNVVEDISKVPLPEDPAPQKLDFNNDDSIDSIINLCSGDVSEKAVRSISNMDKASEKNKDLNDTNVIKTEDKVEEKPRAIISQEETEDAVAALLGESFGEKNNTFEDCYDQVESNSSNCIENSTIETPNIREEDAEEMRRAVQNLNASEMEIKPDTPLSDNDLLLIDTDTEETEDNTQDAIEKLPVNIIATTQTVNSSNIGKGPPTSTGSIVLKSKLSTISEPSKVENPVGTKLPENVNEIPKAKRANQPLTSTATPVITSWTLSNNKLSDSQMLNVQKPTLPKEQVPMENKSIHKTGNIVQMTTQNQNIQNAMRPVISPGRVSTPYQVINQMIRSPGPNLQPPSIKIPESHILYQKPPGIVISPRLANEPRLHSPKSGPQEALTSPRLSNINFLSNSLQNINSVVLPSPNTIPQRSPGQVTVVRMQQPPLSPIQTMHLPRARTMLSPTRPTSVLVQAQGSPIHFNRLPVTPVLAPITKPVNTATSTTTPQPIKTVNVTSTQLMHQQKLAAGDCRKSDSRNITDNLNENSKIILSPTNYQQSTNPTVMAQNRLMSMQNTVHLGNMNHNNIHLSNKVNNNILQVNEKRDNQKLEHIPFSATSMIHVTGVNPSTNIKNNTKPIMCTFQDATSVNRGQGTNVIHSLNTRRIISTTPVSNILHLETNKSSPSCLSVASVRPSTILTKLSRSNAGAATTATHANVVMTPLLLKNGNVSSAIRIHTQPDQTDYKISIQNMPKDQDDKAVEQNLVSNIVSEPLDRQEISNIKQSLPIEHNVAKCETDFEELLKDNTNEIKVTNDPESQLEVNIGKTVTLITTNTQTCNNICKLETIDKPNTSKDSEESNKENNNLKEQQPEEKNNEKVVPCSQILNNCIEENLPIACNINTPNNLNKDSFIDCKTKNTGSTVELKITTENEVKPIEDIVLSSVKDEKDQKGLKIVESVIKKLDTQSNENTSEKLMSTNIVEQSLDFDVSGLKEVAANNEISNNHVCTTIDTQIENVDKIFNDIVLQKQIPSKRGGRSIRGRRLEKNAEKTQTRQISKPIRGNSTRRGRGRSKVDKKIKSLVHSTANNIPGDVYDFHEDSGDETTTSPQKSEARPRLILTIKSPLSGHSNALVTSTLSITQREELKNSDKIAKDDNFVSPSSNTRKSRRLQEKDVHKNVAEDPLEDTPKNFPNSIKTGKKKAGKQTGLKGNNREKPINIPADTRKSPRGVKRTRDRSLSEASVESNEDRSMKGIPREAKTMKLQEPRSLPPQTHATAEIQPDVGTKVPISTLAPQTQPVLVPTPITKPPKKMISEISAKLASALEATPPPVVAFGGLAPGSGEGPAERTPARAECRVAPARDPEFASSMPGGGAAHSAGGEAKAATGETRVETDVEEARLARLMIEAAAAEACSPRVQSPALPHRAVRVAREWEEGEGARRYGASLPRGAHHPPPATPATAATTAAALLAKQVALVRPHHHLPGVASRVTITSVPAISPQGQVPLSAELVRSPPPAHQHTSPVTPVHNNGDGMYYSHQHYQMYQQHFHATQHEARTTPSPYFRGVEEGCEAPTPPLELRRPPSARVPRPAHSPAPAPADRLAAARVSGAMCGRSPPPAHGTSRLPAALPPPGPPGPLHGSQVPREADSLQMLLRRYPVMWQGLLALKNDSAAVQMHFVGGNPGVAGSTLQRHADGSTPPLRIAQRMRLEPLQLDQVHRKMKMENEHCILLALPCGRDHMDVLQQSNNLTAGFITYLQSKQAAGIVNVAPPGHQQAMYTVHIFPSCDFANENLNRIAPDLMHRVADIAHLLIVIATV